MKISLNWLRRYVDVPDDLQALDVLLTGVGLEVEGMEDHRTSFEHIVVGEVRSCEKHPNADKLSVCTVFDGVGESTVVCGAPNVASGQKIIFARVGAHMEKAGFTIERRKLRGVESAGMICSTAELGLDEHHDGIAVLEAAAVPGTPIVKHLGLDDVTVEIGITPNRGDALSHIGVARDIAAATGAQLRMPEIDESLPAPMDGFSVSIEVPGLCPRYSAGLIEGVEVKESPEWLQKELNAAGLRPINTVVDVTNYVMLEIGQPMHAFDMREIKGNAIVVRTSSEGERFTTLDDIARTLPGTALMICDAEKAVAVAGVMGGQNSAVADDTTSIVLESACFNPSSVRRTSKRLGLSTDSSYRFERATDPNITVWAIQRAAKLLGQIAGGRFVALHDSYPQPVEPLVVSVRPARVNAILGMDIPTEDMERILRALRIGVEITPEGFSCTVPTFRPDLEREIDLVEEIARIYGYDHIPTPTTIEMNVGVGFDDQAFTRQLRHIAIGLGLDEILSSSLVGREHASEGSERAVVEVLNPVSKERPALRGSLLPSLLEAIDINLRNGMNDLRIFEIGRIFEKGTDDFDERTAISFALTGSFSEREWYAPARTYDFFDLKGVVEAFLRKLHLDNDIVFSYDAPGTLSKNALRLELKGLYVGRIMELSDEVCAKFSIEKPVYYAELELPVLQAHSGAIRRYTAVPRFPVVDRDIAVIVDKGIAADELINSVRKARPVHLLKARLVDVFEHESIGAGKKSVAITLSFQAPDHTLKEEEIVEGVQSAVAMLQKMHGAVLRG